MPEETPQQLPDLPNSKYLRSSLIAIGALVIGISVFLAYKQVKSDTKLQQIIEQAQNVNIPTPLPTPGNDTPDYSYQVLTLKRDNANPSEIIFTTSPYPPEDVYVQRLDDQLYFVKDGLVQQHDLNTGVTRIIFKLPTTTDMAEKYISNLNILNESLYVSATEYMLGTVLYEINLADLDNVKKYTFAEDAVSLIKLGNHDILRGGAGDGCGGRSYYKIFNQKSKSIIPIGEFGYGCGEGDKDFGYDSVIDSIVYGFYEEIDNNIEHGIYKNIASVSINNPSKKKILLSQKDMPVGVSQVVYSPLVHELILVSPKLNSVYSFNLISNKLEKLFEFPVQIDPEVYVNSHLSGGYSVTENAKSSLVCIITTDFSANTKVYGIDTTNNKLIEDDPKCWNEDIVGINEKQRTEELKTKLEDQLKLPSNYSITVTTINNN